MPASLPPMKIGMHPPQRRASSPLLAGTLATTVAAHAAARGVSRTSPVAALSSAEDAARPPARALRIRTVLGLIASTVGALLLVLACANGFVSPFDVLVGFADGTCSIRSRRPPAGDGAACVRGRYCGSGRAVAPAESGGRP